MNYTLEIVALIVIVLLLVYSQQLLQFLNLLNLKFKISNPTIVSPNEIDRDILVELAKLEKFLYKERFTRRVIIKDCTSIKKPDIICYKFYYYQLIDGIHAYIEATVKSPKKVEFNIHFETQYDSNRVAITTNEDNYLLKSIPENIYLFKKDNLPIEKLYRAHLSDREIINETIYKKRLNENDLIHQAVDREQEQISQLARDGYIKYTDYGYKLIPTFKLFRNAEQSCKIIGIDKSSSKVFMILVSLYIAISILFFMAFFFSKEYTTKQNNIPKIIDTKSELKQFKERVKSYKGLTITLSTQKAYTIKESMKDLDEYLKQSKIKRFIGKPLTNKIDQSFLPCKMPSDLEEIYRWHNGIELIVPNRDFFRYSDLKKSYLAFKDKLKENNSDLIFVFASKYEHRGLAYSCSKSGIYEYALNAEGSSHKEFYNFNHFLKITAEAYKQKAFYDDYDTIKIDLKKFFKIYRTYLSRGDIHRYKSLIKYLYQKSNQYRSAPKKLKIELLQEIANSYDSSLIKSAKLYLNDSNPEVVAKAIYALGNIGNKATLPTLIKFLKSKNQQFRDFALLAIAKIVDSKDEGLLEYIYPMLNDKSILVRLSAYKVIEKIASKNSLIVLREHFKEEKHAIKLEIVRIFAKTGGDREFALLKDYLKEVNKMNFSSKIKDISRGNDPHPKILQYEIVRAIAEIASKKKK